MDMTGEYRIAAPREKVWEALNDPEILKRAIPGCQELTKLSETELTAKVTTRVGPVSATFTGKVTLSDLNPPESYTISGDGQGGPAGFAKGGAKVRLAEDGAGTQLSYQVNAQIGGKLAQIGSRLIDGTAKKLAGQFFESFAKAVGQPTGEALSADADGEPAKAEDGEEDLAGAPQADSPAESRQLPSDARPATGGAGLRPGIWVTALIVATGLLALAFALI